MKIDYIVSNQNLSEISASNTKVHENAVFLAISATVGHSHCDYYISNKDAKRAGRLSKVDVQNQDDRF